MNKSQQMRWSRSGADLLLQVGCAGFNGKFKPSFGQLFKVADPAWEPAMAPRHPIAPQSRTAVRRNESAPQNLNVRAPVTAWQGTPMFSRLPPKAHREVTGSSIASTIVKARPVDPSPIEAGVTRIVSPGRRLPRTCV